MKKEYSDRTDNFFKFKDKYYCKRVYDLLVEIFYES